MSPLNCRIGQAIISIYKIKCCFVIQTGERASNRISIENGSSARSSARYRWPNMIIVSASRYYSCVMSCLRMSAVCLLSSILLLLLSMKHTCKAPD